MHLDFDEGPRQMATMIQNLLPLRRSSSPGEQYRIDRLASIPEGSGMDEGPGEEDADAARADAGSMARVQSLHAASAQQHVGQQLHKYGRCTSSNASTECQRWKK